MTASGDGARCTSAITVSPRSSSASTCATRAGRTTWRSLVAYVDTGEGQPSRNERLDVATTEGRSPRRREPREWWPDARPDTASPAGTDVVLRALADPHRREIIRLIQDTELPAGQIATHFTLTQQAVSQHLTVLKRAGLLEERREGTRRLYRFQPASLEPVREMLDEFWPDALDRLKRVVERDHPKRGAKGS